MPRNHVVTDISNLRHENEELQQVFKTAVDSPPYCWVAGLKKEVALPLPWEPPLSLIGIRPPAGNILFRSLIAAHDLLLLA